MKTEVTTPEKKKHEYRTEKTGYFFYQVNYKHKNTLILFK